MCVRGDFYFDFLSKMWYGIVKSADLAEDNMTEKENQNAAADEAMENSHVQRKNDAIGRDSDLSQFYFSPEDKKNRSEVYKDIPYLQKVKLMLPKAQHASKKMNVIRKVLLAKRKILQSKVNKAQGGNTASQMQNPRQKKSLLEQDLEFVDLALQQWGTVKTIIDSGVQKLERIIETGKKEDISDVWQDVGLIPMPSDRPENQQQKEDEEKVRGKQDNNKQVDGVDKGSSDDNSKIQKLRGADAAINTSIKSDDKSQSAKKSIYWITNDDVKSLRNGKTIAEGRQKKAPAKPQQKVRNGREQNINHIIQERLSREREERMHH